MIARLEEPCRLASRQTGADRHATAETFGQGYHVRNDPGMLETEPGSGSTHAALHLIAHQQPIVFIAECAQAALEFDVSDIDTALALDDFEHDGNDVLVMLGNRTNGVEIVVWNAHKTRHQRLKTGLRLAVTGCRERRHGAAVKSLFHDNDRRIVDAVLMAVKTRQFDRRFVGFAAGVAEENLIKPRQFGQLICQLFLQGHLVQVGGVQQAPGLRSDGRHQLRVIVTQRRYSNTRQCVQVNFAVGVGDPTAVAMAESNGQAGVGVH